MSNSWSRRDVLRSGLAGAAGLALGCAELAIPAPARSAGWIDAHMHAWGPPGDTYPRVDRGPHAKPQKPPIFSVEVALAHARDHGVRRIVLVQPACYGRDHSYLLDAMKTHPGRIAGIGLIDWHKEARAGMKRHKQAGIHGVRIQTLRKPYRHWPDSRAMNELWKVAADQDMALCVLSEPGSFPILRRFCERYPETRVVLDHFGWIGGGHLPVEREIEDLCRFADYPLVDVKMSRFHAFGLSGPPYADCLPTARVVVKHFGPDRVMWGSDAPGAVIHGNDYGAALDIARRHLDLTPDQRDGVLRRTAERLFFRT